MSGTWQDRLNAEVEAKAAETATKHPGSGAHQIPTRLAFKKQVAPFIMRAVKLRGISVSGYCRRAIMTFVALDLGLDPKSLYMLDAGLAPIGERRNDGERDLDGALFGSWDVVKREP